MMTNKEIAERLEIPAIQVRTQLHRAVLKLRRELIPDSETILKNGKE